MSSINFNRGSRRTWKKSEKCDRNNFCTVCGDFTWEIFSQCSSPHELQLDLLPRKFDAYYSIEKEDRLQ